MQNTHWRHETQRRGGLDNFGLSAEIKKMAKKFNDRRRQDDTNYMQMLVEGCQLLFEEYLPFKRKKIRSYSKNFERKLRQVF